MSLGLVVSLLSVCSVEGFAGGRGKGRQQGYLGLGLHLGNVSDDLRLETTDLEVNLDLVSSVHGQGTNYGMGQLRLMLGNTFGIHLSEAGGVNLLRYTADHPIFLIGVEPFNFNFNAGVQGSVENLSNYFEWTPMAAVGLDIDFLELSDDDTCRGILLARGGASIGTLGDGGARPAYGAGFHINCADAVNFGADLLRIEDANFDVDLARVEIQVGLDRDAEHPMSDSLIHTLGFRFESLTKHLSGDAHFLIELPNYGDHVERRGMLLYTLTNRR